MKKLLLTGLLAGSFGVYSHAQMLRASAGIGINRGPYGLSDSPEGFKPVTAPAVNIAYAHPVGKHFEIGAELSVTQWKCKQDVVVTQPRASQYLTTQTYVFANPAVGLGLTAGFRADKGPHTFLATLYGGGVYAANHMDSKFLALRYKSGIGYSLGAGVSFLRWFGDKVAAGVTVNSRYSGVSTRESTPGADKVQYGILQGQFLIALCVKLRS